MREITLKQWSVFLYVISFVTPTFIGAWLFVGFFCFLLGWIGLISFEWTIGLPWLSNILYFTILILGKREIEVRITLSVLSILLGLCAVGITKLPRDEGGGTYDVFVGIGFLFWISSFTLMLIHQIKEYKKTSTTKK